MIVETALALCRFVHGTAAMLLWGAFAYVAFLVPRELGTVLLDRMRVFRIVAIVLAIATTAAILPIETASIGDGWRDAIDPATLHAVLFETSFGAAWQAQAVATLVLAATFVVPAGKRPAATALSSGLLLASLALTGHAAMDEGLRGVIHRLNDGLHVLAGGAWLGALGPFLPVLRAAGDPARRSEVGIALRRFSSVGHGAVALVIATGAVNTMLILGHWPTDWRSPYQALLCLKIALVLIMTALALGNRYGLVPRMSRDPRQTVRALRLATMGEIALGLAAIGCVSLFGLLEPM